MKTSQFLTISFLLLSSMIMFFGCSTSNATLKTYVDPSIQSILIKNVAVFSLRNTSLSPGEALQLDRAITQAFSQKNKNIKLIGSSEASSMLNEAQLVEAYSKFLEDYARSGIANTSTLNKIGEKLGVDAILQGSLHDLIQRDASYGVSALTSLTIRYTLLNTSNGLILWEGTSNSRKEKSGGSAPPLYEVIDMAHQKVLNGLPILGK